MLSSRSCVIMSSCGTRLTGLFSTKTQASDRFIYRWSADGMYTASSSSSYRAFFYGMTSLRGARELWQARAPPKCKFFFLLLLHDRLWMAARRMRHGLQEQELAQHLVAGCVFAREVWYRVLAPLDLDRLAPQAGTSVVDWWLNSQGQLGQQRRKGFDTLLILGAWCL